MTDDPRYDPDLYAAVDRLVSAWPDVRSKQMFGHPGWVVDGTMFASQVSVDPAEVSRLEPWLAASFQAAREAA